MSGSSGGPDRHERRSESISGEPIRPGKERRVAIQILTELAAAVGLLAVAGSILFGLIVPFLYGYLGR